MKKNFIVKITALFMLTAILFGLPFVQPATADASSNSAPQVANTSVSFPAISEDISDGLNTGFSVASLLKLAGASDADGNTLSIAVTSVDDSNGTWQLYYNNS